MRLLMLSTCQMALALRLTAQSVAPVATLLLPGEGYTASQISATAPGRWWVLYPAESSSRLTWAPIVIEAYHDPCVDEGRTSATGRRVVVPGHDDAIALIRGVPSLDSGIVPTATLSQPPPGLTGQQEVRLGASRGVIQGVASGEGFLVLLNTDTRVDTLYSVTWQDEGSWGVRWAGDLNRDGRLDLLLNATPKYSVATQHLFVSDSRGLNRVATFSRTAC